MKLGATLYVKNSIEAVAFYKEAFGLTLGYHAMNSDGTFWHAELQRDGHDIFSVSEMHNDALVEHLLASSARSIR